MSPSAVLSNLSISVDDLLRVQGANPETIRSRRPSIIEMAEKAIQTGSRLIQPAVWMKTLQVQGFRHNTILLENGQQLSGELIAQKLAGARKVAFAIGTLGKALEDEIPAGRYGTPKEIAQMVWNIVHAPEYMTGQIIGVDGGFL